MMDFCILMDYLYLLGVEVIGSLSRTVIILFRELYQTQALKTSLILHLPEYPVLPLK